MKCMVPTTPNATRPLQGLRVLVTRPAHQSDEQVRLLTERGADAVRLPLLDIQPVRDGHEGYPLLRQQMMNLDTYTTLICISPNAARLALEWLDEYWPQPPIGIQWYAIGKKTAATLRAAGIDATVPAEGFDSEAMLTLPELADMAHQRILILRGQGGRGTLAETLSARGARVEYANLYQRVCPAYPDAVIKSTIYNQSLSSILITSGEALSNFVKVAKGTQQQFSIDSLLSLYLVVPSTRIAELADKIGFKQIIVAQAPDDLSMIMALNPANDAEAHA